MGILAWIVLGLIAGLAAKAIMPGDDPGGIVVTIVLGMAGAVIGGFVAVLVGLGGAIELNTPSVLVAIAGAVLVLAAYRILAGRRSTSW